MHVIRNSEQQRCAWCGISSRPIDVSSPHLQPLAWPFAVRGSAGHEGWEGRVVASSDQTPDEWGK
jgi:hypothetical protein